MSNATIVFKLVQDRFDAWDYYINAGLIDQFNNRESVESRLSEDIQRYKQYARENNQATEFWVVRHFNDGSEASTRV